MKKKIKILVTGSNGQLGRSIQKIASDFPNFDILFTDVEQLDITNTKSVCDFFLDIQPEYCINAAAYTAVDKAEVEIDINRSINEIGPKNLAIACNKYSVKLIHISTDYVYNGNNQSEIYTEESITNPENQYAISKLNGEKEIQKYTTNWMIIRTSWLYSEFGNNFVKTILKLAHNNSELNVINDQVGSPTYASDLAMSILKIIYSNKFMTGIYNYSNLGYISWYEFAKEIIAFSNIDCQITPISTSQYIVNARRPLNSKLSKQKFKENFKTDIPNWKDSLHKCLNLLLFESWKY